MEKNSDKYNSYLQILKEELKPAMGCTEPIALAYAAALAGKYLETLPEKLEVKVSTSIIKNVKSVVIPNTGMLKGIEAAICAGVIGGDPDKELEVIAYMPKEKSDEIQKYSKTVCIEVEHLKGGATFEIILFAYAKGSCVKVHILDKHTNVVSIEKDGKILKKDLAYTDSSEKNSDRSILNMKDIWDFAQSVDLEDVREIIKAQIDCNMNISIEGMKNNYGANIGKVLLESDVNSVKTRAKAMAAAGSDARMNGCELPVIINSGSGNQGITVSVPVIVYAKELDVDEEKLYRALVLSNLTAIHQKTGIGTLSAYCGVVSAGAGSGAGIAYLCGGGFEEVEHTVVNAVAILSGMICDGAKSSCAAKIAAAVDAGIFGYTMYKSGQQFYSGDGIVANGIEPTIKNVGRLGREGMKATNDEIIDMMIGKE